MKFRIFKCSYEDGSCWGYVGLEESIPEVAGQVYTDVNDLKKDIEALYQVEWTGEDSNWVYGQLGYRHRGRKRATKTK